MISRFHTMRIPLASLLLLMAACSDSPAPDDAGTSDVSADSVPDATPDVEPDTIPDAAPDAEPDLSTGPTADADATPDAEVDATADAELHDPLDVEPDLSDDVSRDADASIDPDTSTDADATLDVLSDVGGECSYLDLSIWIVSCDGGYRYLREWTAFEGGTVEECPPYYTLGPDRYGDLDAALASDRCDRDCLARAAMSVSYLRCGRRSGYIIYRSDGPECPELYEFPEGIYESFEEYDAAHPCP